MTARSYEFVQLDVFTRTPLTGNPLAVFTDGRGLTDKEMQALAREMNLSETTFVLPRELSTASLRPEVEAREGTRVRIFTVEEELPFAGHPTLGTALHLYASSEPAADQIVLNLNVGKISVRFTPDSKNSGRERVDGNVFGEMRQRDPEFGPILPREQVARALQIEPDQIVEPVQVVSLGLPFAVVAFRNSQTLANLKPRVAETTTLLEGTGARFCYFLWIDAGQGQPEARARMFFYGGEDPATGSAAGCAASWLLRHGLVEPEQQVLIRQGVEAGRPSEIFVRGSRTGDRVTNIRVGGYAVEVLRGTVIL
jgi:trans-2,3-dihydro-3-hydroxyanthranilate isomerase